MLYIPKTEYPTRESILKYYKSAFKIVETEKAFLLFPDRQDYVKFNQDLFPQKVIKRFCYNGCPCGFCRYERNEL